MSSGVAPRAAVTRRGTSKARSGMMLLMRIDRWDHRRDGPFTETALQQKLRALGYEPLPRANPAGAIASARIHPRERAEAVVAGLIKVTIDGESAILTAGDIVFVPGGAPRRMETVGTAPVVCLEAVSRGSQSL